MKRLSLLGLLIVTSACTYYQTDPNSKSAGNDDNDDKGGENTSGGTTSGGTTSGGTTSGGTTSGGTTSGGTTSGGTSSGGTTKPTKVGTVSLSQTSFKAGAQTFFTFSASAFFAEAAATTGDNKCKTSTEGACQIVECDTSGATTPPPSGTPGKAPHASDITVTGAGNVTLTADDKGVYAAKTGQTELYKPDTDVAVKAKGDSVPAFDKSIKAPSNITVTAPAWPAAGQPFQLDRTKAINLTWTGGTSGDVSASFASTTTGKLASVTCKFPAKDGKGDVPAAALGKLLVTTSGTIALSTSSTVAFDAGDWKLSLMAIGGAMAGTSPASGLANIK